MMYIVSQIFVVINYTLLAITYNLKNRKTILIFSMASLMASAISFAFLSAWSGLAMMLIAIFRNFVFLIRSKKGSNTNIDGIYVDSLLNIYQLAFHITSLEILNS